jgi:hypothetical protein
MVTRKKTCAGVTPFDPAAPFDGRNTPAFERGDTPTKVPHFLFTSASLSPIYLGHWEGLDKGFQVLI